ncbi:MAG: hypothetical protein LBP71_06215 [Spirochaetaceae bacterium]|jgi:hypothetical protein|nr:hypothetical protein [Spirochaetaceae bacterium]
MNRSILVIILGLAAAGLFAQAGSGRARVRSPQEPPEAVTVSGNLAVIDARIGLESGGNTYYVMGIDRLIGFVEGLKEGAPVTLEGYEFPVAAAPEYRYLRVFRLNFNGKDYELSPRTRQTAEGAEAPQPFAGPDFRNRPCPGPRFPGGGGPRRDSRHRFEGR